MGTELEADLAERGPGIKGTSEVGTRQSGREYHTRRGVTDTSTGNPQVHGEGSQVPKGSHGNGNVERLQGGGRLPEMA